MQKAGLILIFVALVPGLASGQNPQEHRGQGYAYFAPGVTSPGGVGTAHLGGGGEGFFTRNLGLGVDFGYLTPMRSSGDGIGTFSPNFVARFQPKSGDGKVEPFVTGGYTLFFRSGVANGFNFGGGLNWWFNERLGLRFEVRDNVMMANGDTGHAVGFRIGLAFR